MTMVENVNIDDVTGKCQCVGFVVEIDIASKLR